MKRGRKSGPRPETDYEAAAARTIQGFVKIIGDVARLNNTTADVIGWAALQAACSAITACLGPSEARRQLLAFLDGMERAQ